MRAIRLHAAPLLALTLGCAGANATADALDDDPREDQLCPELARFANASRTAGVHRVVLGGTMWNVEACARLIHDEGGFLCQSCDHGGFPAGKAFCAYLLKHTSVEFPEINIRRALDCLGRRAPAPPESLPKSGRFDAAPRLEPGVSVLVELADETETDAWSLTITAGPTQALPKTVP